MNKYGILSHLLIRFEKVNQSFLPRLCITILVLIVLMSGYLLLNNSLEHKVDLLLPIDTWIPYLPWTAGIYFTLYLMYMGVALTLESKAYTQVLVDIVLMTLISFACFIVITSHYPRPAPEAWVDSIWKPVLDFMVYLDAPGNTCPSLHVSTSLYLSWVMRKSSHGILWQIWGLLVSLSTLTLKQHFVWDWIGGVLLVCLIILMQTNISLILNKLRNNDR